MSHKNIMTKRFTSGQLQKREFFANSGEVMNKSFISLLSVFQIDEICIRKKDILQSDVEWG